MIEGFATVDLLQLRITTAVDGELKQNQIQKGRSRSFLLGLVENVLRRSVSL